MHTTNTTTTTSQTRQNHIFFKLMNSLHWQPYFPFLFWAMIMKLSLLISKANHLTFITLPSATHTVKLFIVPLIYWFCTASLNSPSFKLICLWRKEKPKNKHNKNKQKTLEAPQEPVITLSTIFQGHFLGGKFL